MNFKGIAAIFLKFSTVDVANIIEKISNELKPSEFNYLTSKDEKAITKPFLKKG